MQTQYAIYEIMFYAIKTNAFFEPENDRRNYYKKATVTSTAALR